MYIPHCRYIDSLFELLLSLLLEFCHDVSDQQMPHIAPLILPNLLKVIMQPQASLSAPTHIAISASFPELFCHS